MINNDLAGWLMFTVPREFANKFLKRLKNKLVALFGRRLSGDQVDFQIALQQMSIQAEIFSCQTLDSVALHSTTDLAAYGNPQS